MKNKKKTDEIKQKNFNQKMAPTLKKMNHHKMLMET